MGKSSSSSKKTKQSRDSSKLRSVKKKKTKRSKSKKIRRIKEYYSDENESSCSDSSLYSSSEDDYRRKKRHLKGARKGHGRGKKKIIESRKRRKRYLSSSSTSSESGSIRDNQSDDGSESDGKRRTRTLGKVKDARRRSKDESEEDSEPDECWQVEDEVMTEKKNSRRLKSIIVVSYTYDKDERKEDMVNDYDDESDEKKYLDDERYREFEEDSKSDNSLNGDDLEAILKKRALENLKRFRGETQKSGIASKEVSSVSDREPLQIESEKAQGSQDRVSAGSKDLETSQKILEVVNVKESGTVLADLASQQDQQSGDTAKVTVSSGISSCTTKQKLIRPVLGQESLNLASRKKAASCQDAEAESINDSTIDNICPESSLALATKNGSENIETTKVSSTLNAQSSSHTDSETLDEIKGGSQSEQKKIMDETKDELQYEQKTMTVMRGGEMVQVSYKVYIPKKTSSLGRRQLKR